MIDRRALVSRHDPELNGPDPFSPLSVGNGEFAFTVDFTGLQTFLPTETGSIPLCTMAQWGWHSYGRADALGGRERLRLKKYDAGGRTVAYMTDPEGQKELFSALRVDPHRLNLARLAFASGLGAELEPAETQATGQRLRLWEGRIDSAFRYRGEAVSVQTLVHPGLDVLAVRVESAALASGKLVFGLAFPYGSHREDASDWSAPEKHETGETAWGRSECRLFKRSLDGGHYFVALRCGPACSFRRTGAHEFVLVSDGRALEISLGFSPAEPAGPPPSWEECRQAAAVYWADFWESGGAVELAGSADPRASELERRIVLSQYLTAIQSAGSLPPQETGLTCNSWYGKFHLEMQYWHAAHFVQWGRPQLLERSLGWYSSILDPAKDRAASQGYSGARWPKMTDPSGIDSPSTIGPLLCWQQPHPIMYAELLRRAGLGGAALEPLAELVFETTEFMADYARKEEGSGRYVLGPPLIPAQECHAPLDTLNPTFELEYWRWGLAAAVSWAEGRGRVWESAADRWRRVLAGLARSATASGPLDRRVYLAYEGCADSFGRLARDHPSMLLALGMLPGGFVDRSTMAATYEAVLKSWDFESCWGWDFPAMAMTAARLGRPEDAVDALLMVTPKNKYRPDGHNAQDAGLPLYLPGNGALLLAVGMMAAGWDGDSGGAAPGFPADGSWTVKVEGIGKLP
ncbi:MAG: hypothetical protein NT061_00280 [Spirochaetes bacterium]|nr:hypothetical protein [Spirochaetota bacterium]